LEANSKGVQRFVVHKLLFI